MQLNPIYVIPALALAIAAVVGWNAADIALLGVGIFAAAAEMCDIG